MKNKIKLTILNVATEMEDLSMKKVIEGKIMEALKINARKLRAWIQNERQPTIEELTKVVEVLREYRPSIQLEDMIAKSDSQKAIAKKFNLVKKQL
jgi:hypothetical protein